MSNLIQNAVFDRSGVPLLKKFLDLSSVRHKLISGNIANVSTPGYRGKDIDFHGELQKVAYRKGGIKGALTHPNHLPTGQSAESGPDIIVDKSRETNGINNVNIDREMANLAENQIYFSVGAKLLANQFQALRKAITSK
ncbi:MAG: flagellar basal body rod protein FlgB [Candidatus Zixiibacteriota bacterium]|nr:MAG: flagellar basal body rod protein FlgB [candidate division Zixibacteria bacterium]